MGQTVNILGFTDHATSVTTTQSATVVQKAAIDNVNEWVWLCSSETLYIKTGVKGHNLLTLGL